MSIQAGVSQVQYRHLGRSGLRVSVPILGAGGIGSDKWAPFILNEDQALPLLKEAWDRGINTWDTANNYSDGESERVIAKAMKKYNIPRSKLVILTKCFHVVTDDQSSTLTSNPMNLHSTRDYVNQHGLSRTAIFNAVSASLARLETTYIDLLQIHRADQDTPFEETMCALNDLVRSGKVRYIGASSMWTWQLAEYQHVAEKNGWTRFCSMQNLHNLLYREEEREMTKYCEYAGIGLIPWSPLAMGLLARAPDVSTVREESFKGTPLELNRSAADEEIIKRVQELSQKKGWAMSQVALAWLNTRVTSPVVGFNSVRRMEEATTTGKDLRVEEIEYLEEP